MNQKLNMVTKEDHNVINFETKTVFNFSGASHVPCDIFFLMSTCM